ncbi:hypothetical protein DACRYDRAFT_23324 [Dacryopinax primogenitus]|uniref:Uncharacterized protein n=1 Tax=Dacryopinax primogenitus (strain DJM 731) TaxID=1858805 RepID=M5FVR0_DACPD|nr:uncharacterized protein DACRYDRAFT_23324 [Dacryopinax primogenitus]EJU00434.1 hypothetical protein DACRYDRAFT_23324 [Dacryopinax primogenitus]
MLYTHTSTELRTQYACTPNKNSSAVAKEDIEDTMMRGSATSLSCHLVGYWLSS